MSILLNGLVSEFLITSGYGSFFDGDSNVISTLFSIEDVVTLTNKTTPTTGIYNSGSHVINGWVFDKRIAEDWNLLRTRYNTFVSGNVSGLKDGTKLSDWQSGYISNLDYIDTYLYRLLPDSLSWTPRFRTGRYSVFFDERNLYSDYSYSASVNDRYLDLQSIDLRDDCVYQTIQVGIWTRDNSLIKTQARTFDYVDNFTGEIDTLTNTRLETEDSNGNLIVNNIAERKREFIITDGKAVLNGIYELPIGYSNPPLDMSTTLSTAIADIWENKGAGIGDGRSLFCNYFPIKPGSLRVVTDDNLVLTEWTEVENLNFSGPSDKHYSVDYDLGIITTGGFKAEDLFISQALEFDDTDIEVYLNDSVMQEYPDQGILIIGSEQILYLEKTRNGFSQLIRGYNNTEINEYSVGTKVEDVQHGFSTTSDFFISYLAIPRIDYEITDYTIRSANSNSWLDLRPIRNVNTNNIVQIHSSDKNLAEVILETDSPLIGSNLYGPLEYGVDISRLTARALDGRGNPVDNINLTIELIEGSGTLNGSLSSYTALTNTLGEIYAFYNAPYSSENIELNVDSVTHDNGNTLITVPDLGNLVDLNDVWLFEILKHDPVIGTIGNKRTVTAFISGITPPYGNTGIRINATVGEEYREGYLYVTGTDNIRYFREITNIQQLEDGSGRPESGLAVNAALPSGVLVGQPVYLFKKDSIEWNSALLNGVRNIVYEFTNDYEHPITGEIGAYGPLKPDSIEGSVITYNNRTLTIPASADNTSNLGAYVVIAPTQIALQASGQDPITGATIQSNILRFELNLPSFLVGVDDSGVLPVPKGFTFITDESNVGAGLGGANFITVNPQATGIQRFSMTGVI